MSPLRDRTLVLFFTYGYSLKLWHEVGIIPREVKPYNKLAECFKEVYFLTYGYLDELKYKNILSENISVLLNFRKMKPMLYSLFAPFIHARALSKADIYKTHQVWGSWSAIIAKLLYRKKLIIRQGYLLSKFVKRQGARLIRRFAVTLLEFFAYHLADYIIIPSKAERDYIVKRYKVGTDKVIIIPNYIDIRVFKPLRNVKKEKGRICFVGRLDPQKNLLALIDAVKDLKVKLFIIGNSCSDPYAAKLRRKIENEGIKNIEFLGVVPNDRLPEELNKSEVFILPSLYEGGSPKALLEAMACELPVIGTDVEGIRRNIKHGVTGYLCGTDSNSIRRAIVYLFVNRHLMGEIGSNAKRYVVDNYSMEKVVGKELAVYHSLIKS